MSDEYFSLLKSFKSLVKEGNGDKYVYMDLIQDLYMRHFSSYVLLLYYPVLSYVYNYRS
jgi:hypothetical protein